MKKLRIKIDLFIEKVLVLLLSAMVLNVLYQIFTRYLLAIQVHLQMNFQGF